MSYRAFKRLLGETSLERKCRFLFGAGILLLITISFWFYAYQTEDLAYNQATVTCRHLVRSALDQPHLEKGVLEVASAFDAVIPKETKYQHHFITENHTDLEPYERELLKEFGRADPDPARRTPPAPPRAATRAAAPRCRPYRRPATRAPARNPPP